MIALAIAAFALAAVVTVLGSVHRWRAEQQGMQDAEATELQALQEINNIFDRRNLTAPSGPVAISGSAVTVHEASAGPAGSLTDVQYSFANLCRPAPAAIAQVDFSGIGAACGANCAAGTVPYVEETTGGVLVHRYPPSAGPGVAAVRAMALCPTLSGTALSVQIDAGIVNETELVARKLTRSRMFGSAPLEGPGVQPLK